MSSRKTASRKSSVDDSSPSHWELRLYVAGQTLRSRAALSNLKQICEDHLPHRYSIEVIDLLQQPQSEMDAAVFSSV